MAETELHKWPLPDPTDTPNVPEDMAALAAEIDTQVPFVCTSTTRPAPILGLYIYETDTKRTWLGNGTEWEIQGQPWTPFTPVFTGWANLGGNYSAKGQYSIDVGGIVTVEVRLKAGTGSVMGNAPLVVEGFPIRSAVGIQQFGSCSFLQTGPSGLMRIAGLYMGSNTDGASIYVPQGATPTANPGPAGMLWQATSELHGTIRYASALGKTFLG